jgi:mRNA interferase MazF
MANRSAMRFRVVLVPFPFDDLSGQKVRPAVCLTNAVGSLRHVVLAFITSTVPATLEPTDIVLTPGTADFASTGLRVHSTLRLHRMVTVAVPIIRRQLGALTPGLQSQVQHRFRVLFAL